MEDRTEVKDIDVLGIMRLLPHRYPFILVDRITSLVPRESVEGLKNVTMNEQFFQGHFPGQPVMPGVLILEGMAQTGGCMAFCSVPEMIGERLVYFAGIDKCRFKQPVVPGDQMILEVDVIKEKRGIWKFNAVAKVDDNVVASAELMCAEQAIK